MGTPLVLRVRREEGHRMISQVPAWDMWHIWAYFRRSDLVKEEI